MLRATKVPEALETICCDGVKGALLMTRDGALLGSAGEGMDGVQDQGLGAIASSVWEDLAKAAEQDSGEMLQVMMLDLEVRAPCLCTRMRPCNPSHRSGVEPRRRQQLWVL